MNSGAIELNGKYYLVVRVEGNDRKSFFAVAESDTGIDGFHFWDYPVQLPDTCPEETNVYDMRLTKHEDGWIYGVFCSESKDKTNPDLSAAVAASRYRTHKRSQDMGASGQSENTSFSAAEKCSASSGVCRRQICILHTSDGWFH